MPQCEVRRETGDLPDREFQLDLNEVFHSRKFKRNVVKMTAKLFAHYHFCQELCEEKVGLVDPLSEEMGCIQWGAWSGLCALGGAFWALKFLFLSLMQSLLAALSQSAWLIAFCEALSKVLLL